MKLEESIKKNRYERIVKLINRNYSLSEICIDEQIQSLFLNVKDVRSRIRKIMNKHKYVVYKDYFFNDETKINTINSDNRTLNNLKFSKTEIIKLKKIIKRWKEIELIINEDLCNENLMFSDSDKPVIENIINNTKKIENFLNKKSTKTIRVDEMNIENHEIINSTIRINKKIFDDFWKNIEKDDYLKTLKKTDIFNIIFYEMNLKLKGW